MGRPDGLPEQLQAQSPGRSPHPRQPAASPLHVHDPHVEHTVHPLHHPVPRTNWPLGRTGHRLPRPCRLCPPPPPKTQAPTRTREDKPDDPHIWGTWENKSLDTLLSISSGNEGLGRAMYCLAKWTQRTWGIPTDRWLWKVTLRPLQLEAPPNRKGPTLPRPTALQLYPYMVAPRLMALLWPGPDTPTQNYPHHTEEDKPGHPAMLPQHPRLPPANAPTHPGAEVDTPRIPPLSRTAQTTPPHHHIHLHRHRNAHVTRKRARTSPVPDPAPSSSLLTRPIIRRPPPLLRAPRGPPQPSPPPPTPQPQAPQPPRSPPQPRPRPAFHPPSCGENLPNGSPKPVPTASNPAAAKAHAPTKPAPAVR